MVVDMELQEAKDAIFELMKEKDKIESKLLELTKILDNNHVDMSESLVDSEEYPRHDIDVYQVRRARHDIICLTNDHKVLMAKIEEGIHKVHALTRANNVQQTTVDVSDGYEAKASEPFLRVNLVSPGSPAENAGLQKEDLILKFGSICYWNFKGLTDIKRLAENSKYQVIFVKIKRKLNIIILSLTPRPWAGEGLLGCSVIPLEAVER